MRKPCCDKKQNVKGAWSEEEDQKLKDYIQNNGQGRWHAVAKGAGLQRCGKSCRLRWMNYLKPDIQKGNFGEDEDDLIIKLHALLGNRWSLIAGRLPGRTDNEIKNYWNIHLSGKVKKPSSITFLPALAPNHSDEYCSTLSSCSDNRQHKSFNSSSSSKHRVELPDLNIEWTSTCYQGDIGEW